MHRLFDDDKLILAEVRITSLSLRTSKRNRIVLWSRIFMQRSQALVLFEDGIFLCQEGHKGVRHSSQQSSLWSKDDRSSHRMDNGDFLMVEAFVDDPSLTEAWNELKRCEEHECNRRLFTTPPEVQMEGEQNAACSQEGEALGSEEVSPRDFSSLGEAVSTEDEEYSLVALRLSEKTDNEVSFFLQVSVRRSFLNTSNYSYFLHWDNFSGLFSTGQSFRMECITCSLGRCTRTEFGGRGEHVSQVRC